jgi:OOP family OmpA-OmpF porin
MQRLRVLAVGSMIALVTSGCTVMDRKWGGCAIGGALVGGTIGGITGGATYNNSVDDAEDDERGAAIATGIVAGAAIGAILGHVLCDPEKEPPPPPPVAAPPPPPPPPPPAPGTKLGTVGNAFFDFNRAEVKGKGEGVLEDVTRVMKEQPSLRVRIEGHTDSVGGDAYNQKLSERRAQAVKTYLVRQGIDESRIETEGFGESKPTASNSTAAGRAENRRVEIIAE